MHYANEPARVCLNCADPLFPCVRRMCARARSPSLSPRARLVQKRAENPETEVLWLIWNIDFTLTADSPADSRPHKCRCKGKGSRRLPRGRTRAETHVHARRVHYAYKHISFLLMDSLLPWREHNSKSMRWRSERGTLEPPGGLHPECVAGLVAQWLQVKKKDICRKLCAALQSYIYLL